MSTHPSAEREKEIFEQALGFDSAEERSGFIKGACSGDAALLARVQTLLKAHENSGGFLPAVAGVPTGSLPPNLPLESMEGPGGVIGRYKLLQRLGEGGCGVVYMAEQEDPVRRRVALKIIRLGMDTREVIARFEVERQALALMDHPNIAKVFDAGATATGRPYFVMELVRGVPITRFCDENNLTTAERIELFVRVCHAVQHAHQKAIIHRDLKPSNILVAVHDTVAVPKIIDFGIAKASQGRLTDRTLFTAFEQFIGTPAYMSPEQAQLSGLDIDTRSDIYSLGVLLYELLTGRTPFDSKELLQVGIDEVRRHIRDVEPLKPSMRLSTLKGEVLTTTARLRQTPPPKLISYIKGDLDWIVMRCLEKDRTRRNETANALALDLDHFVRNEPVAARPPSPWYILRKLAYRHRTAVTGAIVFLMLVVTGSIVSTMQLVRAQRAESRDFNASWVEEQANAVHNSLLIQSAGAREPAVTLRAALDRGAKRLDEYFIERRRRPQGVEVIGRQALSAGYRALGEYALAEAQALRALALSEALVAPKDAARRARLPTWYWPIDSAETPDVAQTRLREVLRELVVLHQAWAKAEPDAGKVTQAAEWQRKLEALERAPASAEISPRGTKP